MRIHELSKKINISNKELVEFLSSKNSEIKSHMSSVSDQEASLAEQHFTKKSAPKSASKPAPASTAPTEKIKKENTKTLTDLEEVKKDKDTEEKPQGETKKRISAVYNPQNSGRKEVRDQRRPNDRPNNGDRPNNNANRPNNGERPAYNNNRPNNGDRPYNNNRPNNGERPAYNNNRPNNGDRPAYNNNRPNNGDRPAYNNNRPNNGDRPAYNNNRPNNGDRPAYNNNRPNNGDRPAYNNNRPNTGDRPAYNNNRPNTGDRPAYNNNRPNNGGGSSYGNRPNGGGSTYGNRPNGGGSSYGNRPNNGAFGNRNNNGGRPNAAGGGRPGDRNAGFRKDKDQTPAFDGVDGLKEREAKEQRSREWENRKKDVDTRNKAERLENTKALEKNIIKKQQKAEEEEVIKTLVLPDILTIKELADKMKIAPAALVKKLFLKGTVVTINQDIDFDTAEEIALEYNCICEHEIKVNVIEELLKEEDEDPETLVSRPPVVCVMGHVDHGKTSLLDAIRETNVTEREAGGITQHIGAYTVNTHGQNITFLDTPGHEAFTSMRMRGAKSTDIAILVVAADDGVMPQTIEAINHAKAAGIEIVVAVNKMDKPSANIERVKQELVEYELIAEDWGGSTIFCPVSAHTKDGIDNLLDMLLLTSEMLELKANPDRKARGLVIEGRLDKSKGPVSTLLVQKGTLHVGDFIAVGSCHGKIRAMTDDKGRRIQQAGPSIPVEILGLNDVPNAGDVFVSPDSEKEARSFAETYISEGRVKLLDDTKAKMSLDDLFSQIQAGSLKELDIIVKADVQGSVEAVRQSLVKLSNEEVVVKVIHAGVGAINESDVILASASNAIIIGFNVRPDNQARMVAEREKVDLRLYRVIYQAIEDVEAAMKGMLDPKFEEKVIGHVEIRQIYKASGIGNIAGAYVLDGIVRKDASVRLMRGTDMIYDGPLASLKRFKDDAKEVKEGYECGVVLEKFNDIAEGDVLEVYTMVEIPR